MGREGFPAHPTLSSHTALGLADDLSESQQTEEPDAYPTPAAEGGDLYAAGLSSAARIVMGVWQSRHH